MTNTTNNKTTPERLNKIIARSGYCSRRKADELLAAGRVTVNGKPAPGPGARAAGSDDIRVDGTAIQSEALIYLVLNKPGGYITTTTDPHAAKTVYDLLPRLEQRVFPVGRLDKHSSGLLLFTNDGALAQQLLHPRFGVERRYVVTVDGFLPDTALDRMRQGGMVIEDYQTNPCRIRLRQRRAGTTTFEITLTEGRKRQIRRMCEQCGVAVTQLTRVQFGNLHLGRLTPGQWKIIPRAAIEPQTPLRQQ